MASPWFLWFRYLGFVTYLERKGNLSWEVDVLVVETALQLDLESLEARIYAARTTSGAQS